MRRKALQLIGPTLILVGAIWAAIAVASTTVQITKPSGNSESVTIDENEYKTYRFQEGDGFQTRAGEPLSQVLKEIGIGDGAWISITINGLTVENGTFKNKRPPIFFIKDQDEIDFYKPKSAEGPYETRSAKGGSNLVMSYQVPLDVKDSDDTPKAGQTVTYTASVPGGGPQSAYEFNWSATGGTPTSGTGPTFKFTYPETGGEVTINVSAKRGNDSQAVGSTAITSEKLDPKPQETTPGTYGTGGYSPGATYGTGGYTPSTPTYPTEPNFPGIPSDTGVPDVKQPTIPETPTGTSVTGELLSLDTPAPTGRPDATSVPPDATPQPDQVTPHEPAEVTAPGAVIAAGVIFSLLGLGAGREFESFSPRGLFRRPNLSGLRRLSFPRWK